MKKVRSCYKACRENNVDAVRQGLEEGFVVNSCDRYKKTLLHVSAEHGCTEIVSFLLENMADVNAQNYNGNTPLHLSASYGCTEIVSLLLEYKADVNVQDRDGYTPLHLSALYGHKEIAALLLANMNSVNVQDKYGWTPLHDSADGGHKEIVSMLLSKNADINVQDKEGRTPLHWGAWRGHTETVSLLLANKADVSVKNNEGFTAIDYARKPEVVNVLLKHGAVRDKQGRRPFKSGKWSQLSATTSVKVTLTSGVEDNDDISASTSFSHTRTTEIKDEVTNTVKNDETTSDPAQIYKNTGQHKIPGLETISTSEGGQVLASAIAGRMEQAVADCLKEFSAINSTCQPCGSTDVSTSQQNGATIVSIHNTVNVNINNEINIRDTRDVKCQNAKVKGKIVSLNGTLNVYGSTGTCEDVEGCDESEDVEGCDESEDEVEK